MSKTKVAFLKKKLPTYHLHNRRRNHYRNGIPQKTTDYPFQTVVELTPLPSENYEFVEWSGDLSGSEVPKQIIVDGERTVTVKFRHVLEKRKLQRVAGRREIDDNYPNRTIIQNSFEFNYD